MRDDDDIIIRPTRHDPRYLVSNRGEVWSVQPNGDHKRLTPWPDTDGRPTITVCTDGRRRAVPVSKLVAAAFLPEPAPGKEWVLHENDNPHDNRVSNLYHGSAADNARDAYRNGRRPHRHSEETVGRVRALRAAGLSLAKIAAETGVSPSHVRAILTGRSRRPRPNEPSW